MFSFVRALGEVSSSFSFERLQKNGKKHHKWSVDTESEQKVKFRCSACLISL